MSNMLGNHYSWMDIDIYYTTPRKEGSSYSACEWVCEHCTDSCKLYVAVEVGKEVLAIIYHGGVLACVQFGNWIWYVISGNLEVKKIG
jgi:hypothetical protein